MEVANTSQAEEILPDTGSSKRSFSRNFRRLSVLKNKYLIAVVFFLVWMLFFNEKDLISEFKRREQLKELQKSEKHLTEIITETRQELSQLKSNAQTIERYARERYLMKKDNEDLFIFPVDDSNK